MANPSRRRQLTTKDDYPLDKILDYGLELIDTYNDAPKGFVDLVSREVDSRTFITHTGDMTWQEAAEMEHARTGTLESHQMAFSVKTYNRSLAYSREHIEDYGREQFEREFQELIKGADTKTFEIMWDVMRDGIADGTELWYEPDDYGAYEIERDRNHTFEDTEHLFGDSDTYTPSDHIREANKLLRQCGKTPDVALMSSDLAGRFVKELTDDAQYHIPEAEGLRETALPDTTLIVDGVRLLQTAWLTGDEFFVYASNEQPVSRHTVRPVELTDSDGAPVSGGDGREADPARLIGSYGSMRLGAKMTDPLAGVRVQADSFE